MAVGIELPKLNTEYGPDFGNLMTNALRMRAYQAQEAESQNQMLERQREWPLKVKKYEADVEESNAAKSYHTEQTRIARRNDNVKEHVQALRMGMGLPDSELVPWYDKMRRIMISKNANDPNTGMDPSVLPDPSVMNDPAKIRRLIDALYLGANNILHPGSGKPTIMDIENKQFDPAKPVSRENPRYYKSISTVDDTGNPVHHASIPILDPYATAVAAEERKAAESKVRVKKIEADIRQGEERIGIARQTASRLGASSNKYKPDRKDVYDPVAKKWYNVDMNDPKVRAWYNKNNLIPAARIKPSEAGSEDINDLLKKQGADQGVLSWLGSLLNEPSTSSTESTAATEETPTYEEFADEVRKQGINVSEDAIRAKYDELFPSD